MKGFSHGEVREVIFTPRENYNGWSLRPELKQYEGQRDMVEAVSLREEGETYEGEWVLTGVDGEKIFGMSWLTSGDFSDINEVQ